ncbi:MAG: transglycosylase SLT domain-containing protein [Pseudomonadales bacterium]|jgi:hypothetical protein
MLRLALSALLLGTLAARGWAAEPAPLPGWQDVVAATPYWESKGAYANLTTIRRWVLTGSGYCEEPGRHILFDRRMRFLGYLTDPGDRAANQDRINAERRRLARAGRVGAWVAGAEGRSGYPFVLSCDQPDAYLPVLVGRYFGNDPDARLWGTWDGLRIGTEAAPVSLDQAIREVYRQRRAEQRIDLPESVLSTLAGKVIIESGGVKEAASAAGAVGIMQLSPAGLSDCRLEAKFQLHRLAQIDCALYLLDQNHRNLGPVFDRRFGNLPAQKAENLYRMLLVQSYHTGIGRVISLLDDPSLNGPARYFAAHADRFSAGDIALGMVFHNLGRDELGFAALYYVADVAVAAAAVCERERKGDLPGCDRYN